MLQALAALNVSVAFFLVEGGFWRVHMCGLQYLQRKSQARFEAFWGA
jgi:hypothetical protein